MGNSIVSNIAAYSAQANINIASNKASTSIARLSSGNRITKASDDVAGLATGTALRTQVTALKTALSNAAQGTSLLQVADGALGQIIDMLQRQKAIASQAASGQLTDTNRAQLDLEFQALTSEIDRVATSTNFNGVSLLAGGLGSKTSLARTDALAAAAFVAAPSLGGGTPTVSTTSIQAFDKDAGTAKVTAATTLGHMFVSDSSGTILANTDYLTVDSSVYGQFSSFEFSNVTYGATTAGSATLTVVLNGVEYSGNVVGNSANVAVTVSHGSTYLRLGLGAVDFTNNSTTEVSRATIQDGFATTVIARTQTIEGIDFTGTSLDGVLGSSTTGIANIRIATSGNIDIGNFKYESNGGAADTNHLSVVINGQTWNAVNVDDSIVAGGNLVFTGPGEVGALMINTTGLNTTITNIRTSQVDRDNFINALNLGFSKAGSGLDFSIGSTANDNIRVSIGSGSTASLYNGATLSVASLASAQDASSTLDTAIDLAVELRAKIGGFQSRFDYATNAVQSAMENQDAARSLFLDTDVSAESTAYASAQVQLQAGISVLAQANLLQQNLLKLIGG